MLRTKPHGKYQRAGLHQYHCMLRGGYEMLDALQEELGIGHKADHAGRLFSLEEVECIGACCWAPAMQVNYDFHDNLTPEKMDAVLETSYRQKASKS